MKPYPENKPGVMFTEEESLFPVINYLVYRECHPWWVIRKHLVDRFDMTYCVHGGARYVIDGVPYELMPGDLICLKEGVLKEAATYSKNLMHCFSVNFELRDIRNQVVFLPFPQFSRIGMLPDLVQHFHELVHASFVRQPGYMLQCAGLLFLILHRIYELTVLNIGADVKDGRIQNIIRYIVQHYAEQLSVRYLADKTKLNPAYLGMLFKKETGESIHQY
ncbi:MAG: AraC family ligand binding domain-containing protein, partial [Treponema sp.]|nr:AraC family ligand binding domain-containing protein [Treponema sp.]